MFIEILTNGSKGNFNQEKNITSRTCCIICEKETKTCAYATNII